MNPYILLYIPQNGLCSVELIMQHCVSRQTCVYVLCMSIRLSRVGAPDTITAVVHSSPVALICVLINHSSVTLWVFILIFVLKFNLKSGRRKFSYVFRSIESRSGDRSGTDGRCVEVASKTIFLPASCFPAEAINSNPLIKLF
jgi:hypothetical protein